MADQNEADILKAGEDFKGRKDAHFASGQKADDPFQFLAACREWFRHKTARHGYSSGSANRHRRNTVRHPALRCCQFNHHDGDLVNLFVTLIPTQRRGTCTRPVWKWPPSCSKTTSKKAGTASCEPGQ